MGGSVLKRYSCPFQYATSSIKYMTEPDLIDGFTFWCYATLTRLDVVKDLVTDVPVEYGK